MIAAKIALLFLSAYSIAFGSAYVLPGPGFKEKAAHEIQNFPPVRSQDGVGLCYAFSSTALLNYEYCKQNGLDCKDPKNQLSVLDVSAHYKYFEKAISIGGIPGDLLSNLKAQSLMGLYTEECLPFELLAHKDADNRHAAQMEAIRELKRIFNMQPRRLDDDRKACLAREIQGILPIQKDVGEIMDAYYANSPEQFIYQVAVKDECKDERKRVKAPNFHVGQYPRRSEASQANAESTLAKIEKLVLNDIPVSLSICSSEFFSPGNPQSCGPHALTVTGVKESCLQNNCVTLLKVHNSYGQIWQERNNDGWVEADSLIRRARAYHPDRYMTWISEYENESQIPDKKLKREQSAKKVPASSNSQWGGPSKVSQDAMPADIDPKRGPIFRCDGNYFGDWVPDQNCKFMNYSR